MLVLALTIALGSFGVTNAFAEEIKVESTSQVVVRADDVELEIGESVSIGFYANGYVNVAGFHFTLVLPSNVTFAGLSMSAMYSDANYQHSVNGEEVSIICNSSNEMRDWDVTMFYIQVVAREVGYGEIWFRNASMVDVNANSLDCSTTSVGITVEGEQNSVMMGDVDGDENVTLADLMLMQRYVLGSLGYEANFSTEAADVNGDYDINLTDCQHVQRYLVGKISFDELQSLAGNGGGVVNPDNPSNPDYPVGDMVYDVYDGADLLQGALKINTNTWETIFTYDGLDIYGTSIAMSMIDEEIPEGVVAFVPNNSSTIYQFTLSNGKEVKLEGSMDLEEMLVEHPAEFNPRYAGIYKISNGNEIIGEIEINEEGLFIGKSAFNMSGTQIYLNVNGVIDVDDDGKTYAWVLGAVQKEIEIFPEQKIIMPVNNLQGQEFEISYVYPDGMTYVQTAYYQLDASGDIYDIAKKLAHANKPSDFNIGDIEIIKHIDGRIQVKVYSENSGSGEIPEGKNIMFYMVARDGKSEMFQPMGNQPIASAEQLMMMVGAMSQGSVSAGMQFAGVYLDKELKTPYTEEMGIEIDAIYLHFTLLDNAGKLLAGMGGTYSVKQFNQDTGELKEIRATLTLNDKDSTFIMEIDGKTVTGEAILTGGSYYQGEIDYASLVLINNDETIQFAGNIDYNSDTLCFQMYNYDDFSAYETNEDFKEIAGEYNLIMEAMGMQMAKCPTTLKDNGVVIMNVLYMKQIGYYVVEYTEEGSMIFITADGETMPGTIDFDTRTIIIDMSSSMGGGNATDGPSGEIVDKGDKAPATFFVVMDGVLVEESKTEIHISYNNYEEFLQDVNDFTGGLGNAKIYLDAKLKVELTSENFNTVNVYYIAIDSSNLQNVNSNYN